MCSSSTNENENENACSKTSHWPPHTAMAVARHKHCNRIGFGFQSILMHRKSSAGLKHGISGKRCTFDSQHLSTTCRVVHYSHTYRTTPSHLRLTYTPSRFYTYSIQDTGAHHQRHLALHPPAQAPRAASCHLQIRACRRLYLISYIRGQRARGKRKKKEASL